MAATAAVFQSLLPGEHVVAPQDAYYGTAKLLREVMAGWGSTSTLVDMTDPARGRRGGAARDPAHLDRDAVQPGARRHRHRARRGDRARGGRALRLRQHLGHARAPASARARLRRW